MHVYEWPHCGVDHVPGGKLGSVVPASGKLYRSCREVVHFGAPALQGVDIGVSLAGGCSVCTTGFIAIAQVLEHEHVVPAVLV